VVLQLILDVFHRRVEGEQTADAEIFDFFSGQRRVDGVPQHEHSVAFFVALVNTDLFAGVQVP
jgi:hypothetical protein